jgi:hypothetical protein
MKMHARFFVVATLALAVALPGLAGGVDDLGRLGTAYGWQSGGNTQGDVSYINNGMISEFVGHSHYGATVDGVDGWFYIDWDNTAQSVQSIRWFTSYHSRGLSEFTLYYLKDSATDRNDPASWEPIGVYPNTDSSGDYLRMQLIVLDSAVTTRAIKLSYENQNSPLTGAFELYGRDMTPLAVTHTANTTPVQHNLITDAYDNDMTTRYGSGDLGGKIGMYELALVDGRQAVDGLQIYFSIQDGFYEAPEAFTLKAWDVTAGENGDWRVLATVTGWQAMDMVYSLNLDEAVLTDTIRLEVTTPRSPSNVPGGAFGISEFYIYAAIPEPATMSLLALGGLALLRRRK